MEALQSPQCDDFDDDANIATTTGKKQHHHHPSDGEEREQEFERRTGRVRVSEVFAFTTLSSDLLLVGEFPGRERGFLSLFLASAAFAPSERESRVMLVRSFIISFQL